MNYFYVFRSLDGRLFASKLDRGKQPWRLKGPDVNLNQPMILSEREARLHDIKDWTCHEYNGYLRPLRINDIVSGRLVYIYVHHCAWFDIMDGNELGQYMEQYNVSKSRNTN